MIQPDLFEDGASATPAAASQAAQGAAADCSAAALQKVDAEYMRRIILEEYKNRPSGATADELLRTIRWRVPGDIDELNIRPRVSELKASGLLVETGDNRKNKRGNSCAVLVYFKFAEKRNRCDTPKE